MILSNRSSRVLDKRKEAANGDMITVGIFIIKFLPFATLLGVVWFIIRGLSQVDSKLDVIDRRLTDLHCRGCKEKFASIMDTLDKIEESIRSAGGFPKD